MNLALLALLIAVEAPVVDVGFDASMAATGGIGWILTRLVVYPLVMMRRRLPNDSDDNTGPFIVPRQLHATVSIAFVAAGAALIALLAQVAVLPAISAGIVGLAVARATREAEPTK